MRIIFMGTPEFAVASLESLVQSEHEVVGVVTVADKPAGRGKKLRASAVKEFAMENNIEVLQPEKLRDESFIVKLTSLNADLFIVVAFRMLPKAVWSIPNKGTFNIHASILPQYRGAAPINHAIINGDTETGLTTFMIDEKIDTGKIILQHKCSILADDDAGILHDRLMQMSRKIVLDTCALIKNREHELISQTSSKDNADLKSAPKIFKQDYHIPLNNGIDTNYNLIRGLSPYPAAFIELINPEGEIMKMKIFRTKKSNEESQEGKIYFDGKNEFALGHKDGRLLVIELQLQSKKRMITSDFMRGFSLNSQWKWR